VRRRSCDEHGYGSYSTVRGSSVRRCREWRGYIHRHGEPGASESRRTEREKRCSETKQLFTRTPWRWRSSCCPYLEQEAAERKEAGRKEGGKVSGRGRAKVNSSSQKVDSSNEGKAAAVAAATVGTNRQYVADAKKLMSEHPTSKTPTLSSRKTRR
jgi:hypothetical protein